MKNALLILVLISSSIQVSLSQQEAIEADFDEKEALSHFRFLAADELRGRDAARPEIDIAARYIAEQFWKYGAQTLSTIETYFQEVPFRISNPPQSGSIQLGDSILTHGENMLVLDGEPINGTYELVVAGYGLEVDLKDIDLEGKILVARVGEPGQTSPSQLFAASRKKLALAKSKGAVGLMEMYHLPTPWSLVSNFLNKPQMLLSSKEQQKEGTISHVWVKDLETSLIKAIDMGKIPQGNFKVEGKQNRHLIGKNVVAVIEGTDPKLKEEYVMLSAHYDHIGVGQPDSKGDSIYNP